MTRYADPSYTAGQPTDGNVAQFSPDGEKFTVVLKRGNLERNTNEYSLSLWRTAEVFHSRRPELLLTFSSSSNREAIKRVTWLDNDTIAFLGENPGESQQLYTLNIFTKELKKLTSHATSLVSYAISSKRDLIAFGAESQVTSMFTETVWREGISVSSQYLSDLIMGINPDGIPHGNHQLFLKGSNSDSFLRVETEDRPSLSFGGLLLSPDGKYLIVPEQVKNAPEAWRGYEDARIQMALRKKRPKGVASTVRRYLLIDTSDGTTRPLLDAPIGSLGSEVAWSPDSQSVVITGMHLPLDVLDISERRARESSTFVVQIRIPSRELIKLTRKDLKLIGWDPKTGTILFEPRALNMAPETKVAYRKIGARWDEVKATDADVSTPQLDVILDENLNTPPKIFAVDPRSHRRALLMELNPQFSELRFGRVQSLQWKATDGHEVKGGLYYPPEYVPGLRYPLIIQTHGFDPNKFWVDGPWTTAFAAQPLANRGFVVLQVQEGFDDRLTPNEPILAMSAYDGAIDYLDDIGLIDRARVGLIGFSRTCLYIKYTLTHSRHHYSAAVVADGMDAGYFQYLAFSNSIPDVVAEFEAINGTPPFGEGLSFWLKRSPSFGLARVRTALQIQAVGPVSLLGEWEWFSGLSRLGKPVDLIYVPDGSHILEKPWERMTSQQGSVDWFCFWLKGEEDPDPAKARQYARWRKLRELQVESEMRKSSQ
jgi:dipeptidyl aminopeptidase/acylaminoacyl peptidase